MLSLESIRKYFGIEVYDNMNSVQRLFQHIKGLNALIGTDSYKVKYLYHAWGMYFLDKTEKIEPKEIWFLVNAMSELLDQARKSILIISKKNNPHVQQEEILYWYEDIEKSINLNMDAFVSSANKGHFNRNNHPTVESPYLIFKPTTFAALKIFSAILGEDFDEKSISDKEIKHVKALLDKLNDAAKQENTHLKEFIKKETIEVNRDIDKYKVKGGGAFHSSVERIVGKIIANKNLLRTARNQRIMAIFRELILYLVELAKKTSIKFFETLASEGAKELLEYFVGKIPPIK